MTLDGTNDDKNPAFIRPSATWTTPPTTTASRNAGKPNSAICVETIAVNPAAGPATLVCEPLSHPTRIPPTIPASTPANSGAPEANATPKHNGKATKKTTKPAVKSRGNVAGEKILVWGMRKN